MSRLYFLQRLKVFKVDIHPMELVTCRPLLFFSLSALFSQVLLICSLVLALPPVFKEGWRISQTDTAFSPFAVLSYVSPSVVFISSEDGGLVVQFVAIFYSLYTVLISLWGVLRPFVAWPRVLPFFCFF